MWGGSGPSNRRVNTYFEIKLTTVLQLCGKNGTKMEERKPIQRLHETATLFGVANLDRFDPKLVFMSATFVTAGLKAAGLPLDFLKIKSRVNKLYVVFKLKYIDLLYIISDTKLRQKKKIVQENSFFCGSIHNFTFNRLISYVNTSYRKVILLH